MISGLSHVTFVVKDIERMTEIMTALFEAKEVYDSGATQFSLSREKFFLVGDLWIAVMEGEPLQSRTYNHIAFKIAEEDFELYLERIKALDIDVRPPRPRVDGEGRSIYFYDNDNHMFELHTGTLTERLARYAKGKEAAK
jgi:catechol 2,3-dioxygenase-like lactoylglutathione lyase family enzyme